MQLKMYRVLGLQDQAWLWRWLAAIALFLMASACFAHGVANDDKAFLQQNQGPQLLVYAYLGAKHMVTGYDHLLFLFGVIFFSGSIYLLATNSLTSFDFRTIGFVTPIGGLLLIMAWGVLLVSYLKKKS